MQHLGLIWACFMFLFVCLWILGRFLKESADFVLIFTLTHTHSFSQYRINRADDLDNSDFLKTNRRYNYNERKRKFNFSFFFSFYQI